MPSVVRGWSLSLLVAGGIFYLDQVVKQFFFEHNSSFSFLAGWIQSIKHENYGIAFNLPVPQGLILSITFLACLAILWAVFRAAQRNQLLICLFLGFLLGGALGNAYDRWQLNYVRDWLLLWHRSAINLADLGVLFGLVGIVILETRKQNQLPEKTL
jgi:signal peptidase II